MSMMLVRDRGDMARFAPMAEFADGRSTFTTAKLTEHDIELLRAVQTSNPAVRARVNDVLWENAIGRKRIEHVHLAIDAYFELAELVDWHISEDLLHRAHELATRFQGADGGERKERVRAFARARLDAGAASPGQLLDLCEMLRLSSSAPEDREAVLKALSAARGQASESKSFRLERNIILELQQWVDDESRVQDLLSESASLWVDEANSRLDGESRSAFVATSFLEKAVQQLRAIPRKHRERLNVANRIEQLRTRMVSLGEEAVDEMTAFDSPEISLQDMSANARRNVKGLSATEALVRFATIASLLTEAEVRAAAEEILEGTIARLFPTTSLTRDGRVADRSDESEAVDRQMAELAQHHRVMVTLGQILPALRTMRAEHSLGRHDFVRLAYASAIVPPGQEQLFATGLYAGWNFDADVAVHLLVPRTEALVRHHLKSAGALTTHLNGEGIDDEIALPALLEKAEATEVFGVDLVYELQGVYAGRFGSNLRHDVAHGLVTDSIRGSVLAMYAWWLTLRIVTVPFWNPRDPDPDQPSRPIY
ncbi:DUF4209 domain-containing protein [Microbacterium trichothecenolyticum]|nr:DUF4209 domain-containing protein [Microbacterium trichothecenolyticum]MBW9121241.1 DUF4209 domain-containing protein [Microbacterium trichothecenolyticum]